MSDFFSQSFDIGILDLILICLISFLAGGCLIRRR